MKEIYDELIKSQELKDKVNEIYNEQLPIKNPLDYLQSKGITPFKMTNKYDMFQYVSTNPVTNSRYNYSEMKCVNDKWTKRKKPKWFDKLGKKINEEKEKLKGANYKSDPKTLKTFSRDQFDEACHYIGLI